MKAENFEIVAVAQDSGGEAVAGEHYDRANATFTTLIDEKHLVTALYGMINVPAGVWIDERGKLVRPPEVAYSKQYRFGSLVAGDDRYAEGLRDWIERGAASPYALSPKQLALRLRPGRPERRRADVHFQLATYLHAGGRDDDAKRHYREAQALAPDNWNYHRQPWSFDPATAGGKWQRKFRELGEPYYRPVEFPRKGRDG